MSTTTKAALQELVRLKDLKERIELIRAGHTFMKDALEDANRMEQEYRAGKGAAWAAARAALAAEERLDEEIITDFDMLGRYVGLNLNDRPQQQALILRKLGKIFATLRPGFRDDELMYPWIQETARSWLNRTE